ncbi:MAG: sugar phosphate nucleotidyltransferase [Candidatus Poribacteria bacterium]|nr:sugar phosphate nucleotidyltransferase [Candidatus Poribacteria bacterium]
MSNTTYNDTLKGVILAGGLGTRLYPLTKVTSKHLLPVGNEPMVFHTVRQLTDAGIKDILIVTNPSHVDGFVRALGSGKEYGCDFTYRVQEEAKGIAHALALAEGFAAGGSTVVMLGDNIFESSIRQVVMDFKKQQTGARVLLKQVDDPERFGVANFDGDKIVSIEEKPENPKSNFAVVGVYIYDSSVFEIIRTIEPSQRGEYEITSVNNVYIERGQLSYTFLQGEWIDAGTFDSLADAHRIILSRKE